jgi:DNA-binding XRE family transcriptional regulator
MPSKATPERRGGLAGTTLGRKGGPRTLMDRIFVDGIPFNRTRVGRTLAQIRGDFWYSQRDVALAVGLSARSVQRIEGGEYVELDTFLRLAVPLTVAHVLDGRQDSISELERRVEFLERLFEPDPPATHWPPWPVERSAA